MAKFTKNSGFSRQDAVIGQMQREAKQAPSNNSAAAVAMRNAKRRDVYVATLPADNSPRMSFRFLFTGK
jgi:hypothetical protein